MIAPIHIKEGLRMVRRTMRVKKSGFHEYPGNAEAICKKIIDDAFDKERGYFRVSSGHFCEFYVRDFAFCCEALVELGYADEVRDTLRYALLAFAKADKITTSISPSGVPFDFPNYAPDSLALLLYALSRTNNREIADQYHAFLQSEINRFTRIVPAQGSVLPSDRKFSSIRDHAGRKGACYDAIMIAIVAREAPLLGLHFDHQVAAVTQIIANSYWNGTYFFQDLTKQGIVIGDANVFPFWSGIFSDKEMIASAMTAIRAAGLDTPLPLRYVSAADKKREKADFHIANFFASGYETDSVWAHLGLCYLRVLAEHDPLVTVGHLQEYRKRIEQYKTFLEVYDTKGQPFRSTLYMTDEAMVWCANWLVLAKKFNLLN